MQGQCENTPCQRPARYALYKTLPSGKIWIHVCGKCEGEIGMENLRRAKREGGGEEELSSCK